MEGRSGVAKRRALSSWLSADHVSVLNPATKGSDRRRRARAIIPVFPDFERFSRSTWSTLILAFLCLQEQYCSIVLIVPARNRLSLASCRGLEKHIEQKALEARSRQVEASGAVLSRRRARIGPGFYVVWHSPCCTTTHTNPDRA